MPQEYKDWLDTGEESLRRAAHDAAYAWYTKIQGDVWGTAKDIFYAIVGGAGSDPGHAAWLLARRVPGYGRVARQKYLDWMVEYLEEV